MLVPCNHLSIKNQLHMKLSNHYYLIVTPKQKFIVMLIIR